MAIKKLFASINTLRRRLAGWLAFFYSLHVNSYDDRKSHFKLLSAVNHPIVERNDVIIVRACPCKRLAKLIRCTMGNFSSAVPLRVSLLNIFCSIST